jgi:hypothetical protein
VNDEELRDLQERVSIIQSMTETGGWALFVDAAYAVLEQKASRITQGKCENHEDYRAECAFSDGVKYLIGLPGRLQKSLDLELVEREELAVEEAAV